MALQLKTLKTGADDAPVFLLLHGFGGFAGVWSNVAQRLDGTVLAVDLPGHGASLNHEAAGRAGAMADAIAEALRSANIGPVYLSGHSMGGAVASLLAAQNPDLVQSLLLLAPGGFGTAIDADMLRAFARAGDAAALRQALAPMCASRFDLPNSVIEAGVAFRQQQGQLEKLIEIGNRVTKNRDQGVIPKELLANIQCPTRIIWGRDDALLPAQHIFHAPPHFEPLLLDGMGHMLIEEAPDLVASHLNGLVDLDS